MIVFDMRGAAIVAAIVVALGAAPIYAGVSRIGELIAAGEMEAAVSAEVVAAERLWLRELVSPFRRRAIYEITYEYRTGRNAVMRGTGIRTQSSAIAAPTQGTKLGVRYRPEDPGSSLLEDPNRSFDAAVYTGIGLLLWVAAGVLAALGFRARQRPLAP